MFVALQLFGFGLFATTVFPHFAPVGAPALERAAGYVAAATPLRIGNFVLMLPAPFFLLFIAGLAVRLRRAGDQNDSDVMIAAAALSGSAMSLVWPLAGVISTIALDIAVGGGDAATVSGLDAIAPYSLALSALPRAMFLTATSTVLLERSIGPRWVAWGGIALAALALVGSATLIFASLFPLLALSTLAFELWLVVLIAVLWPGSDS